MAALVSVVASSLTKAVATFDAAMDPASLQPHKWSLTPQGAALGGAVVQAFVNPGALLVDLLFSPNTSAGGTYTITATDAALANGTPLAGNAKTVNFVAPAQAANPAQAGFPHGLRESFLEAVAAEMQILDGRPTTMVVAEVPDGATTILVESTLGFPSAGAFWLGDRRYVYFGTTPASFLGVLSEYVSNGQVRLPRDLIVADLAYIGVTP